MDSSTSLQRKRLDLTTLIEHLRSLNVDEDVEAINIVLARLLAEVRCSEVEEIRQHILSCPATNSKGPALEIALSALEEALGLIDTPGDEWQFHAATSGSLGSTTRDTEQAPPQMASRTYKSRSIGVVSVLRTLFLDIPLIVVFALLVLSYLSLQFYVGPISTYIESFRREEIFNDIGILPELNNDITYYNRQCTKEDITTGNANDLLLPPDVTNEEAADTMMTHGAVMISNVLTKSTASQLRDYLEGRHEVHKKGKLPYQERFWSEIGRLALGLGAGDDPIIAQALSEVGNHPVVKRTVEGILGKDPAVVEISTLTAMHGAEAQGTQR